MVKHLKSMFAASVLLGLLCLAAVTVFSAEGEEPTWHKTFDGHEMWMTSLDDALAASSKDDKPMLIDVFSPT
jgi:hypothetical protein